MHRDTIYGSSFRLGGGQGRAQLDLHLSQDGMMYEA